jgi:DMSO/TMAO reductase YedYZ heme-binding membrane subunit
MSLFYGPPEWLVNRTTAKGRRAFGFWTFILAVIGACFFGRDVLFVTVLSILALVPNFSSETPVEEE